MKEENGPKLAYNVGDFVVPVVCLNLGLCTKHGNFHPRKLNLTQIFWGQNRCFIGNI